MVVVGEYFNLKTSLVHHQIFLEKLTIVNHFINITYQDQKPEVEVSSYQVEGLILLWKEDFTERLIVEAVQEVETLFHYL